MYLARMHSIQEDALKRSQTHIHQNAERKYDLCQENSGWINTKTAFRRVITEFLKKHRKFSYKTSPPIQRARYGIHIGQ